MARDQALEHGKPVTLGEWGGTTGGQRLQVWPDGKLRITDYEWQEDGAEVPSGVPGEVPESRWFEFAGMLYSRQPPGEDGGG